MENIPSKAKEIYHLFCEGGVLAWSEAWWPGQARAPHVCKGCVESLDWGTLKNLKFGEPVVWGGPNNLSDCYFCLVDREQGSPMWCPQAPGRPRACSKNDISMIIVFTLTNINTKIIEGKLSKIFISEVYIKLVALRINRYTKVARGSKRLLTPDVTRKILGIPMI